MEDNFGLAENHNKTNGGRPRIWTSEETDRLIELWSEHDILYNVRHQDYYKRDKRVAAMNEISMALGDVSVGDITRKMENLRSYYGREKRKMSDPRGCLSGEAKPRWIYYEPLSFLEAHMNQKRLNTQGRDSRQDLSDNIDNLNTLDDIDGIYVESEASPTQSKHPRLNDRGKLDAAVARLQKPRESFKLGPRPVNVNTQKDINIDLMHNKDQTQSFPDKTPGLNELNDDMIFAEHVGRTIMSITDELLKEDLKLQIQQCLCSTKRKQIALQQQEQQRQQLQNNATFVSFATAQDLTSPVNSEDVQILPDDTDEKRAR